MFEMRRVYDWRMKTVSVRFSYEEYAALLDAMSRCGFTDVRSFVYAVVMERVWQIVAEPDAKD